MIEYKIKNIAQIVNGKVSASTFSTKICKISIDSRTISDVSASLFVAIKGLHHDGHDYVEELYLRGVRCFIVSNSFDFSPYPEATFIQVENSLEALQQLAAFHRSKLNYPLLAITGSNGKTIVKEWLYDILQHSTKIIRSPKSYNSQVGVPLTLLQMGSNYDLAIVEAGISQVGEMSRLEKIIAPDWGLITNIGEAHQQNFENLSQKIDEKLKLFAHCQHIVYCKDQPELAASIEKKFASKRLFSWSAKGAEGASLQLSYDRSDKETQIKFNYKAEQANLRIPFVGSASLENASSCLAYILASGQYNNSLPMYFSSLQSVAMRLEIKEGLNDCVLINDYYNSDIKSLEIALQFQARQCVNTKLSKLLILSDIEQSEYTAQQLAVRLNKLFEEFQLNQLIIIGDDLASQQAAFSMPTRVYSCSKDFIQSFNANDYQQQNILLKGARKFKFERIASLLQKKRHQTQLEINLDNLVANLNTYREMLLPSTKIMAMVKAFSYGSGTVEVARALAYQQIDYLAVAVADEGIELRNAGVQTPIVVMNPEQHSFQAMIEHRLEPNIYSMALYRSFANVARSMAEQQFPIHIKLETGMNRLGFCSASELEELLVLLSSDDSLSVASIFSHLAVADEPEQDDYTTQQYEQFVQLAAPIKAQYPNALLHLLNSAGSERFPQFQMDMVRLGIGLYGHEQSSAIKLRTVASWTSLISQIKDVPAGQTIGYGRRGKANVPLKIAILPVGYADGYDRRLANGVGKVYIQGAYYPTIGNICMDMCMIDITGSNLQEGDSVELMGVHIPMDQLAEDIGTIPYEILTSISQRVHRVYIQE